MLCFLFVACVADGLEVVWVVGASVGEVGDVVYLGCGGGAAWVVELAGVVVAVEGGLAEFLPLVGGGPVGGLVVPGYLVFTPFLCLFNCCLHLCLLCVVCCVVVCTYVGYVRVCLVWCSCALCACGFLSLPCVEHVGKIVWADVR